MSSSDIRAHVHPVVERQERYTWRRKLLRDFLLRPIGLGLLVKAHVIGLEHIPSDGPTLIMMNHIAAIDPAVITAVVKPRYVVPMSKIENYRNPLIRLAANSWGVFPIRRGEVDRQALASTIELLNQSLPVLIAPEGTRQPALVNAKDGVTYIAVKANAMIVPVGLDGTQNFPSALKQLRRPHVTVRFGPAFRFKTDGSGRVPRDDLRVMTQEAMYQLAMLLPEHRRGAYSNLGEATTQYLEFV